MKDRKFNYYKAQTSEQDRCIICGAYTIGKICSSCELKKKLGKINVDIENWYEYLEE